MSGAPPHMTTLIGVAQRGWSGQICDMSDLLVSFLLLLSPAQVAFLYQSERSIFQNSCFWPRMCLSGFWTISDYKKPLPNWPQLGISQPNLQKKSQNNYINCRWWRYTRQISHIDYWKMQNWVNLVVRSQVTYFWNYGTLSISPERVELETSNLARIYKMKSTNKMCKIRSKGLGRGHMTYCWNFGTPCRSLEWVKLETSNLACI